MHYVLAFAIRFFRGLGPFTGEQTVYESPADYREADKEERHD